MKMYGYELSGDAVEALCVSTLAASCGTAMLQILSRSHFVSSVVAWCVFGWVSSAALTVAVSWIEFLGAFLYGDQRPLPNRQESLRVG
jgi:hypothetical protein